MTQQAIGWNIHLRYLKNPGKLIERLREYQPSTSLVMVDDNPDGKEDQTPYIVEVARQLAQTLIVARVKSRDDAGFHTKPVNHPDHYIASPENFLNKWGHLGRDNMTLYALNEPNDGIDDNGVIDTEALDRLVAWWVELADKAAERGVSITGPNFGKGVPGLTFSNQWHPAFDPILHCLSKHRGLHFMGLHEYGPEEEPYHLGRYKAMQRRCAMLGIPAPRIIITEWGVDKADTGDQTVNGYKSRKWTGAYYVTWLVDKLKQIYGPDIAAGNIVGLDIFSMGASSPDWAPFNVEEDQGFWGELKAVRDRGELLATTPAPVPAPDVIWIRAKVHLKFGASVNLRAAPDVTSADLGDITGYSPIEYDSSSPKNGWYHVRYQDIVGYASADYFEPTSDEPPRLPFVPVQANLGGPSRVTIQNNGNGYRLQAIASNDHVQKVGQLSDGEQVTLYRSTRTVVDGVTWYYLARDVTPVAESPIGWIPYTLPPPPPETPPAVHQYVIKVVITATEEQTAQIAAGAVSLFDFMATFSDVWKGVRPQIVIEDMSQVAQGAKT